MAALVCYLVATDRISDGRKFVTWKLLNDARGNGMEAWLVSGGTKGEIDDLPHPMEGNSFTVMMPRYTPNRQERLKPHNPASAATG